MKKQLLIILSPLCFFYPSRAMRMPWPNEREMCNLQRQAQSHADAKLKKFEQDAEAKSQETKETMKFGIDVIAKDNYGDTALLRAARDQDIHLCELLLDAGAEVNAQNNTGQTALMYACRAGLKSLCELLLRRGANITIKNMVQMRAIDIARQRHLHEIANLLAFHEFYTDRLSERIKDGNIITAQEIITHSPTVLNSPDRHHFTPLMYSAVYDKFNICRLLLKAGALVHLKQNGRTVLDHAKFILAADIIELLHIYAKDTLKNRVLRKIIEADEIELSKIFDGRVTETQLSVLPNFIEIDRDRAECIN